MSGKLNQAIEIGFSPTGPGLKDSANYRHMATSDFQVFEANDLPHDLRISFARVRAFRDDGVCTIGRSGCVVIRGKNDASTAAKVAALVRTPKIIVIVPPGTKQRGPLVAAMRDHESQPAHPGGPSREVYVVSGGECFRLRVPTEGDISQVWRKPAPAPKAKKKKSRKPKPSGSPDPAEGDLTEPKASGSPSPE